MNSITGRRYIQSMNFQKRQILWLIACLLLSTSRFAYSAPQFGFKEISKVQRFTLTGEYALKQVCPPEGGNCTFEPDPTRPELKFEEGNLYLKNGFVLTRPVFDEFTFRIAQDPDYPDEKIDIDLASLQAINGRFIYTLDSWLQLEEYLGNFSRSKQTYTIEDIQYVIVSIKGEKVQPTVSISADQTNASEAELTNGRFLIKLDTSINKNITVYFSISGLAKNGLDYKKIKKKVVIPAGQTSAYVTIETINDTKIEITEKVKLTLSKAPAYKLGNSKSASIEITDDD